ncbi:MAG: hypothetical protein IT243_06110 [Bacteroidia bacterium]|nr:hypothetical protein [Bacteroidia bacterium]
MIPLTNPSLELKYSKNRRINQYRSLTISAIKLLVDYSFPKMCLKVDRNNKEFCFEIYLFRIKNGIELDMGEVERFRNFWGSGLKIKIVTEDYL